jgi:hypothetical protein
MNQDKGDADALAILKEATQIQNTNQIILEGKAINLYKRYRYYRQE